ncbi:MAG: glycosyltransferase [Hyphomonadaceae bacterium JAD_PAG50586_4]|nr:MAG: glycosyltransferase [Hyphomonadaceae bacterium JAD_PAG50586_4]
MISVILPTLNAARMLPRALSPLVEGVAHGIVRQVIVSDGGSRDETLEIADAAGCDMVTGEAGRTAQMRAGVTLAKAPWLLFLPATTALAPGWPNEVERFLTHPNARERAAVFKLVFAGDGRGADLAWARFRTRWLKLPYAAQGLLISRALYDVIGGYGDDIARRIGGRRLHALEAEAVTQREAVRESSGV